MGPTSFRAFLAFALIALFPLHSAASHERKCETSRYQNKHRLFVLTDMSNEPDDQMSLVRLLTYANEIDIRGISATTSVWQRNETDPDTILTVIGGYGNAVKNLNKNVPYKASYPSETYLRNKVFNGHAVYGLQALNLSLSEAATELIKAADDAKVDDPLWVSVWGGATILAEALYHVSQTRDANAVGVFVEKLRVYSISDQDDTGPWIRDHFPQLFYIVSLHGWNEYVLPTWIGISGEEYRHFDHGGPDSSLVSNAWLQKHIRIGSLGSHYLNWSFIMEGDTPAYLTLVQNGLGDVENPQWGSWGGRYSLMDVSGNHRVYSDAVDYVKGENGQTFLSNFASIWRWREDYQYDFAARVQWTINGKYEDNNHQPVAVVNGSCGPSAKEIRYKFGDKIVLDASESWDPDGDELKFEWFHYRESSGRSLEGFKIPLISEDVDIVNLNSAGSVVSVEPQLNKSMHLILSLHDDQDMPLVSYRRLILQPY